MIYVSGGFVCEPTKYCAKENPMTKTDWTAEEVRTEAAEISDYGGTQAGLMLTDYASLLAEIERAKAGVTDGMVHAALRAYGVADPAYEDYNAMRAALESVAHLLPRGEVEVGENAVPVVTRWRKHPNSWEYTGSNEISPEAASVLLIHGWERQELFTHPPAQAAHVDDVSFSTVEKVVKALCRIGHTFPESQEEQAARFESMVLDLCREVQSHFDVLTTAEPVAQGETHSSVEQLAELMRGLEMPPVSVGYLPSALFHIGRAIAKQAKEATQPAQSVDVEAVREVIADFAFSHPCTATQRRCVAASRKLSRAIGDKT
jgi:hypothetical protein